MNGTAFVFGEHVLKRFPETQAFLTYLLAPGTISAAVATQYDATILAWVPVEVQIERTMQRDGCDQGEVKRRIDAQLPIDEKREMADFVIDNSGSREETAAQVRKLYAILTDPTINDETINDAPINEEPP